MGAGGKGSSGKSTTNQYHGTLAGALGSGPGYSLEWIIGNGKIVFQGPLLRVGAADYVDITLVGFGAARLYWGTETQGVDPTLQLYDEQPAYRGIVYIVLKDINFGINGETNPPNLEFCWRRHPNQTIVTGGPAATDSGFTANAVAVAAEILNSWDWAGLPAAKINGTSFQNTADSIQADVPSGGSRSFAALSPLWNEQNDLRAALADLCSVSSTWLRLGADGRIEAGRWIRGGTVTATALTPDDLTDEAEQIVDEVDKLPNMFLVEFTDASKHHKKNSTTPANAASVRTTGVVRRQVAKRPFLLSFEQANRHAQDLLNTNATPDFTIKLSVRRTRATNPDSSYIRPGDYFFFPIQTRPSDPGDNRLFRCTRRSVGPTGPIELTGELEKNVGLNAIASTPPVYDNAVAIPPMYYRRPVPLHPATTDDGQPAVILAARPGDMVVGFNTLFDTDSGGDFPVVSGQHGFQLPLSINTGFNAAASTIRVSLLPKTSGLNPQRDADMLRNWAGGNIEASDDQLVIIAVKLSGGVIVLQGDGITPYLEIMSVAGPASIVSGDTYDIPVLRGRQSTTALAFNAGSFPDAFSGYELWMAHRGELVAVYHPDFEGLMTGHLPAYFRYSPYGRGGVYDPVTALAERNRLIAAGSPVGEYVNQTTTAHQPQDSLALPSVMLSPVNAGLLDELAVVTDLSNGRHGVAANAEGTPLSGELGSGGRATTDVRAWYGNTLLTAVASGPGMGQFSFSAAVTDGTGTITKVDNDTVRVDTMGSDRIVVTITINVMGIFSHTEDWVLWKNFSGGAYWLLSSAAAVNRSVAAVYTPASITFSAMSKLAVAAPAAYAGRFKIAKWTGSAWVDEYVSSSDESSKTYTPAAGISKFRCQLYQAGSFSVFLDEEEIPITNDGAAGAAGAAGATGATGATGPAGADGSTPAQVAMPTFSFSPASGATSSTTSNCTLSCATSGAQIWYTYNGNTKPYSGSFSVTKLKDIVCWAEKSGMLQSDSNYDIYEDNT